MTTSLPSSDSQTHISQKSKTNPSFKLHLIQVEDIESPHKGLYAVLPAYNEELVIGSVVLA